MKKGIGPIKLQSEFHIAMAKYSQAMAKRYEAADVAMMGRLIELDDKIREVIDKNLGMVALKIEVIEPGGPNGKSNT